MVAETESEGQEAVSSTAIHRPNQRWRSRKRVTAVMTTQLLVHMWESRGSWRCGDGGVATVEVEAAAVIVVVVVVVVVAVVTK
ncbi:hypothetical protein E2C01_007183 [Portunus trituberculatus]|uniref:Uncharacterized protein n=1 Tax=Portunus trituberculatus TaxID=210409 RepID=A0A5B7CYR9_PORTR|nr:hypothetical protein [Portunus trituberculatus]